MEPEDIDFDLAQSIALNALVRSLYDQGILSQDIFERHLCLAANRLEEEGLPEAAQKLDELRELYSSYTAPSPAKK